MDSNEAAHTQQTGKPRRPQRAHASGNNSEKSNDNTEETLRRGCDNRSDRVFVRLGEDRAIAGLLFALVLLVAVPGGLLGPEFLREDWRELTRLEHCHGVLECLGPDVTSRPVMTVLWAFEFGVLADHPAWIYWQLNVILAITAVLLYAIFRHFLAKGPSAAIVVLWVILPTHTALTHWASVLHNVLSLLLLCFGILLLLKRPRWTAVAALFTSIAVYESTAPVAILAILFAGYTKKTSKRFTALSTLLLVVESTIILFAQADRVVDLVPPQRALFSNFVFDSDSTFFAILGTFSLLACIGAALAGLRPRKKPDAPRMLIALGLLVVVIGAVPFLTTDFDSMFLGLGDRANQICAIGGAMMWVGVASFVFRRPPLIAAAVGGLVLVALLPRLQADFEYRYVTHTTLRYVEEAQRLTPAGVDHLDVMRPHDARFINLSTSLEQELRLAALASHRPITVIFHDDERSGAVKLMGKERESPS